MKRFVAELLYGLVNLFLFVFAIGLIGAPILFLIVLNFFWGIDSRGSQPVAWFGNLCALSIPVTLGIYILAGGSDLSRSSHSVFLCVGTFFVLCSTAIAIVSPSSFDLDLVWKYLVIFGGVVFCILGFGYLRAPKKLNTDRRDEPLERDPDERLR